jgi:hypothetical protein
MSYAGFRKIPCSVLQGASLRFCFGIKKGSWRSLLVFGMRSMPLLHEVGLCLQRLNLLSLCLQLLLLGLNHLREYRCNIHRTKAFLVPGGYRFRDVFSNKTELIFFTIHLIIVPHRFQLFENVESGVHSQSPDIFLPMPKLPFTQTFRAHAAVADLRLSPTNPEIALLFI